jgi:integrase
MVPSSQASNHADFPSLPLDILRIHKGPLQDDQITAHIGRHTFATTLIRSGTDLVIVADLLGHARLEQSAPTRPTDADRDKALQLLPTDR